MKNIKMKINYEIVSLRYELDNYKMDKDFEMVQRFVKRLQDLKTCFLKPIDNSKHTLYNRKTRKKDTMKTKFPIIENAKRQARMCFVGVAIPTEVKNIDGEMVQVEKVIKFNRTALKNIGKAKKSSSRSANDWR